MYYLLPVDIGRAMVGIADPQNGTGARSIKFSDGLTQQGDTHRALAHMIRDGSKGRTEGMAPLCGEYESFQRPLEAYRDFFGPLGCGRNVRAGVIATPCGSRS